VAVFATTTVLAADPASDLAWPAIGREHRPGTYWWWMGSGVDRANLTRNLETMRAAGLGGVGIVPIYGVRGYEDRAIPYLSPRWMEMLAYTVREAGRLDMWVDMTTGTGWPFGGSRVTPADAASRLTHRVDALAGGGRLARTIDTKGLLALVAYGEPGTPGSGISVNLVPRVSTDGKLDWTAPPGRWTLYAVHLAGTGQHVKRAAPGNEGLVLDPFSTRSLANYLQRFDDAFAHHYSGPMPRAQYHDSFEYHGADATDSIFDTFQSHRGYDLREHLPELFGAGKPDRVARVQADYRHTIADLHLEYIEAWVDWSHQHGCLARNEAHGAPGNLLDLYAAADIPETETFGSTPFTIPGLRRLKENNNHDRAYPILLKFASSAAHVAGRRLAASETCTWLREHFKVALSQAKPEIDQLFAAGINHIAYHGNAYSPQDAPWPGWLFYASSHFEPENTLWHDFAQLNAYVARCQSILQAGTPANDILLYWPIDDLRHRVKDAFVAHYTVHHVGWLLETPFGKLANQLQSSGYMFDYISDRQLQRVTVRHGDPRISGATYHAILVPSCRHIPLGTWQRLLELAGQGATIIFSGGLPTDVPGLANLDARRNALRTSRASLAFSTSNHARALREAEVGRGRFLAGDRWQAMLTAAGIAREPIVDRGVQLIRRTHAEGHHYFLANLGDQSVDAWIPMGLQFQSAVLLDPCAKRANGVAATRQRDGTTELYLQLQPGESIVVRTFTSRSAAGAPWPYVQPAGSPVTIKGTWRVAFIEGGPRLPASLTTGALQTWTVLGDHQARRFAGTARYTIAFDLPGASGSPGRSATDWILDLGDVRESARVQVNGRDAGTLWSVPFRLPIGRYLRTGRNVLQIEVTNLAANRIADLDRRKVAWKKFLFVNVQYRPFDASAWVPVKSGLLGPVRLIPVRQRPADADVQNPN